MHRHPARPDVTSSLCLAVLVLTRTLAFADALPAACTAGDVACCRSAADCDDGDACTLDACRPDGTCSREPVTIATLQASLTSGPVADACPPATRPERLRMLLDAAGRRVDRATPDPGTAGSRRDLRVALAKLGAAAQLASDEAGIDPTCRATLAAAAVDARCVAFPTTAGTSEAPFACLSGHGPLIRPGARHLRRLSKRDLAPGTRIDLRHVVFAATPDNRYPVSLDGGADICVAGATIRGDYDRQLGWAAMHDMNNAAVAFASPTTIDGVRIDDVTDGLRPRGTGPFTIVESWLSYVRDDCVENDHYESGTIDDSLFDGCYVAVSERASAGSSDDGRGGLLTIRRSLLRLEPMPGPRDGSASDLGNGEFFKWDDHATQLAIYDDVFLAEKVGESGPDTMGIPAGRLAACARNVMVWLGPGDYPASLPPCFQVTKDRAVWDDAVARWKEAHPHVGTPPTHVSTEEHP